MSIHAVRAAMPALPDSASDEDVRRLARWAGPDRSALSIAGQGAAMLGIDGWITSYASNPEAWLSAIEANSVALAWRRDLAEVPTAGQRWLRRLLLAPSGLALRWLVGCSPRALPALRRLTESGWAAFRDGRVELPAMRRHWLLQGSPPTRAAAAAAERWLLRYIVCSLAEIEAWTADDRDCLSDWLSQEASAARLDAGELERAAAALRNTAGVRVATDALRRRLATTTCSMEQLALRRALGTAMIDIGAFSDGLVLLQDKSRDSKVKRASVLLHRGDHDAGRQLLQRLGPRHNDRNWALQWALSAVLSDGRAAGELLRRQLETADQPRERAIVFLLYARMESARDNAAALPWYRRAVTLFSEVGDVIGTSSSRAHLARTLARLGRRDEAAEMALEAWRQAKPLPGVAARGFAALACVDAGLVAPDGLRAALTAATLAEQPDLARDARRALEPDARAPIISLGAGSARVDGAPIAIVGQGPPWRLLEYLCSLSSAPPVSVDDLFAAGWPGERAAADSRRRRVHTAIWTLRRAGLRDALETVGRNRYRLRARVISDEA